MNCVLDEANAFEKRKLVFRLGRRSIICSCFIWKSGRSRYFIEANVNRIRVRGPSIFASKHQHHGICRSITWLMINEPPTHQNFIITPPKEGFNPVSRRRCSFLWNFSVQVHYSPAKAPLSLSCEHLSNFSPSAVQINFLPANSSSLFFGGKSERSTWVEFYFPLPVFQPHAWALGMAKTTETQLFAPLTHSLTVHFSPRPFAGEEKLSIRCSFRVRDAPGIVHFGCKSFFFLFTLKRLHNLRRPKLQINCFKNKFHGPSGGKTRTK